MTADEGYRKEPESATEDVAFSRPLKRVVVKEEFVALTGDHVKAIILGQLEYWQSRVRDFDKFIAEEKERAATEGKDVVIYETHGWIYKDAEELAEETMLHLNKSTMRRHLKALVDSGYVMERANPHYKWDKTRQYRLNFAQIDQGLLKLGYQLQGWVFPANAEDDNLQHRRSKTQLRGSKSQHRGSDLQLREDENATAIPEITSETTSIDQSVSQSDARPREELELDTSSVGSNDGLIDKGKKTGRGTEERVVEAETLDLEEKIGEIGPDQISEVAEEYASLLYARFEDENLQLSPTLAGQLTQYAMNEGRWETLRSVAERVVKEKPKHPERYLLASYAREPGENSGFEDRIRRRSTEARIGNQGSSERRREDYEWLFGE